MKSEKHLIQHKQVSKTHTVHVKDLEALRHNAIDEGLIPVYIIDTPQRRWFMVDGETWDLLHS